MMEDIERCVTRASEIFLGNVSDETDADLEDLLSPLVEAGYVIIDGGSPTGHFRRFTPEGVRRQESLGLL
jgi:hypothetical protein